MTTFPCNEVSSRTAGPLFKRVVSPPVPWPLAEVLVLFLFPRPTSKPEFYYPYDLPFYRKLPQYESLPGIGKNTNFFRYNTRHTGYSRIPWTKDLVVRKSFRLLDGDEWLQIVLRSGHETKLRLADFALYATRSERWLAVGPAWDRALGVPLFPESSVGGDKRRVGDCIVDRGPRIWAGYHHPARPTDWTHFLVSKREKTPRGEEGVERRYAAASNLQGFVQGGSEDSDSQLQER